MKQILKNSWQELVDYLVEFSEWDEDLNETLNLCKATAKERKITIHDALFIVMYGESNIHDKEYFRSKN